MDYGGGAAYPGSDTITIIPDASPPPFPSAGNHHPVSSRDPSDGRQSRAGSDHLQGKRGRNNSQGDPQRNAVSKASIGRMFYKTKLCPRFRTNSCPFVNNCNYAHGIQELRKPPPNWQDIVASQDEGSERRQVPTPTSSSFVICVDQSEPYAAAEGVAFLHDEQSKTREKEAINLSGGGGLKSSNWRTTTRACSKWETTGYCPFGSKCRFVHEIRDASLAIPDTKRGKLTNPPTETCVAAPKTPGAAAPKVQEKESIKKWKGPINKISKIYGDWIDDFE